MRTAVVASLCVLMLAACQQSNDTSVTRIRANGVDTLYSKTTVDNGVANFDCIASSSGRCHYLVLDARCTKDKACAYPPLHRLAVAVGKTEQMAGLPAGFKHCVSAVQKEQCHRE
jgi:curli biogenesis system outer membrane secretion channel CsgG